MSKIQEYYPLTICKNAKALMGDYFFTAEEAYTISKKSFSEEAKAAAFSACQKRLIANRNMKLGYQSYKDMTEENINYLDFMSSILKWSENKQVFKFDNEFFLELIKTEDLHVTEDMLEFLPCKTMYLDFSDCDYMKDIYGTAGIFVDVDTLKEDKMWEVHTFSMIDGMKFKGRVLTLDNMEHDFSMKNDLLQMGLALVTLEHGSEVAQERKQYAQFSIIIFQMLCYLASVEPDVRESEATKRTYRPRQPKAPVKNKFSEIQQHEVGVRFGTAFRKYTIHRNSSEQAEHKGSGSSKRPHYRNAHWSWYWYNKLDDKGETIYNVYGVPEKVKRQKWIEGTYVNQKYGESDVIIHKVKN